MQKIYTSYWGNAKNIKAAGIMLIGINRYPPKFIKDVTNYAALAPSKELLTAAKTDATMTDKKFREIFYKEILSKLNPTEVVNRLLEIGRGRDIAILCYEKPPDFCHRHLVAEWLNVNTGQVIEEFPYKK